jgi:transposase
MIGRETRVLLRHYLEQGVSKAAIARELGISRRTVYRWIASGQLDRELDDGAVRYGPRARRVSKLDPYKGVIDARLAEYPELSAVRLFEEVRAAGYAGGYDQVKRYVREVRPRDPEEPVQRFETPPGHQAQMDFAEFRLPWGKRHALIVVLGYSRHMWLQYYERQTMAVVMQGLEAAFRYFRGVPAEILFDQMRAVVVEDGRAGGGRLVENPEFLRFANHWGFRVRACRPYRAQTKGKVERPVRYLRDNFFYGRDFVSDDDLNARALRWLDTVANIRIHGTLKERPAERFEAERPHLLPPAPWPYRAVAPRRVDRADEPAGGRVPIRLVDVERRPLAEYARLSGGAS